MKMYLVRHHLIDAENYKYCYNAVNTRKRLKTFMKTEIKAMAKAIAAKMGKKQKIKDEDILNFLAHYVEKQLIDKIDEIITEYEPGTLISQAIKDNDMTTFKKLTNKKIAVEAVLEVIRYHRQDMFDYLKTTHDLTPMHEDIFNMAISKKNNEVLKEMFLIYNQHVNTIQDILKKLYDDSDVNRMSAYEFNEITSNEWLMDYLIFEQKMTLPAHMVETTKRFANTSVIASLFEKINRRDLFLSLDENLADNQKTEKIAKI